MRRKIIVTERDRLLHEIAVNTSSIHKYNKLMYTLTSAILTYGLSKDEPMALIILYVFITAIYYIVQRFEQNICKISAYIITFLENNADESCFKSETRFYKYDTMRWNSGEHKEKEKQEKTPHRIIKKKFVKEKNLMIYISSLMVCGFFATYKYLQLLLHNSIEIMEFFVHFFIIVGACIVCIIICINSRVIRSERRKKEIDRWQSVMEDEQRSLEKTTSTVDA